MGMKIPEAITFFDMYKVEHPQELNIRERWRSHESHKSLAVPLNSSLMRNRWGRGSSTLPSLYSLL